MSINQTVGSKLRDVRKATGMSQAKLAQRLGYTRVAVTNIEKGRQAMSVEKLHLICQILGCQYTDILPQLNHGS